MTGERRYLLDTNVVSETRKSRPNGGVMSFLESADSVGLFISSLTLGELAKGVAIKQRTDEQAARELGAWVAGIEKNFSDRVLTVDVSVSRKWGALSADRTRPVVDTLIAATALTHRLTLVTRNEQDFRGIDLAVINPWTV